MKYTHFNWGGVFYISDTGVPTILEEPISSEWFDMRQAYLDVKNWNNILNLFKRIEE